jgi:hypothetical protein
MTITFTISWPFLVPIALLLWLPLCVSIGNWLQQEWWFGVLLTSVLLLTLTIPFALTSMVWL